jgi:hypothetical protein
MNWNPVNTIPLDGTEILLKTHVGVVSAWLHIENQEWVCYDDMFTLDEDDSTIEGWLPLDGIYYQ